LTRYRIALIEGDGIGPEVTRAALSTLESLEDEFGLAVEIRPAPAGDACLRKTGVALPEESIGVIRRSDCCLKAPVGESAADVVVRLRRDFDLYANIRPAKGLPGVKSLAPGADLVIVRENTEDLYRGMEFEIDGGAVALRLITRRASERIAERAFRLAESRKKRQGSKVVAVHKSNVLRKSDGVFSSACRKVWRGHPAVNFSEMYVDAAAMNLIRSPESFDVIVTTNLFGDILSDEAAQLVGGLGVAPSANLGDNFALFEPVHGSAPDITNRGIANPVAMLLSVSMMLEWFEESRRDPVCGRAASSLRTAVNGALERGVCTPDLGGKSKSAEVTAFVVRQIQDARRRK
jgi:3-isopropylmalate dehydrogenase